MDNYFCEWYHIVSMASTNEMLNLKIDVIQKTATSLTEADGLELIRVYLGGKARDATFLSRFVEPFHLIDNTLSETGNDLAIRVLAAGTLRHVVQSEVASTDAVILALLCSEGLEADPPLIPNVRSFAFDMIKSRGRSQRLMKASSEEISEQNKPFHVLKALQDMEKNVESAGIEKSAVTELLTQYKQEATQSKTNNTALKSALANQHHDRSALHEEIALLKLILKDQFVKMQHLSSDEIFSTCMGIAKDLSDLSAYYIPHPQAMAAISIIVSSMPSASATIKMADIKSTVKTYWFDEANVSAMIDFCPITACAYPLLPTNQEILPCQFSIGLNETISRPISAVEFTYRALLELLLGQRLQK